MFHPQTSDVSQVKYSWVSFPPFCLGSLLTHHDQLEFSEHGIFHILKLFGCTREITLKIFELYWDQCLQGLQVAKREQASVLILLL